MTLCHRNVSHIRNEESKKKKNKKFICVEILKMQKEEVNEFSLIDIVDEN